MNNGNKIFRNIFYSLFVCLLFAIKPNSVLTESPQARASEIEAVLSQFGIDSKSKFYARYVGGNSKNLNYPEDPQALNIIKHLRSDKGIEIKEYTETSPPEPAKRKSLTPKEKDILAKARLLAVKNPENEKPIGRCINDVQRKEKGPPQKDNSASKAVIFDMLFIDKSDLPLDPAEAFGFSPQIFVYGGRLSAIANGAIKGLRIPCLPFRLRATASYVYREEGIPAFKNYDKDPNGEGVLTEVMKAKLKNR